MTLHNLVPFLALHLPFVISASFLYSLNLVKLLIHIAVNVWAFSWVISHFIRTHRPYQAPQRTCIWTCTTSHNTLWWLCNNSHIISKHVNGRMSDELNNTSTCTDLRLKRTRIKKRSTHEHRVAYCDAIVSNPIGWSYFARILWIRWVLW